jgi:hypothetical protein
LISILFTWRYRTWGPWIDMLLIFEGKTLATWGISSGPIQTDRSGTFLPVRTLEGKKSSSIARRKWTSQSVATH